MNKPPRLKPAGSCVTLIATATLLCPAIAWSQPSSLGAHVHGEAELMIAIEQGQIEMQLVSPAANILGFEHAPANEEQHAQIEKAEGILNAPDSLFSFSGANCNAVFAEVDMPFADAHDDHHDEDHHEERDEHAEHSDHDNDHAQEHHEENHDEHGDHEEHDGHEDEETHTEVSANYQFSCDSDVEQIQVRLLESFPAIESLDAQWITAASQGAKELSVQQATIDLD